jgi:peptidoglycan DL-endopeptidase CwlO
MSVEGFVRSAGAAMGLARESFGAGGVALAPAPGLGVAPTGFGAGSGRAAGAFGQESGTLDGLLTALDEHDHDAVEQLRESVAASGLGRDRMDAVIAAALADVAAMGASTRTPAGQRALVAAIKRHLHDTQGTLAQAGADAQTRAAAAQVSAAGYDSLGRRLGVGAPAMAAMPGLPMAGGGAPLGGLSLAPLASLAGLLTQNHTPTPPHTAAGPFDGAGGEGGIGARVVRNALSQLGVKYSFGGGGSSGPGPGQDGVGLDCSGLVQYAFARAGISVPRTTYQLQHCGVAVAPEQARAGDIVLCNYSAPGVPQHVQIVLSGTQTVEAPDRGLTVRIGRWPAGHFEVRRLVKG